MSALSVGVIVGGGGTPGQLASVVIVRETVVMPGAVVEERKLTGRPSSVPIQRVHNYGKRRDTHRVESLTAALQQYTRRD